MRHTESIRRVAITAVRADLKLSMGLADAAISDVALTIKERQDKSRFDISAAPERRLLPF